MSRGPIAPVFAGLASGIAFVLLFSVAVPLYPVSVKLNEEWDKAGQQRAVDTLLTSPDVRAFVVGKKFEVWAYGPNFPQSSLHEGVCDRDKCTLIGIRELNADGSVDCALKTFVNIETGRVDDVQYARPCNEVPPSSSSSDYRVLLRQRTTIGYELADNDPRVNRAIQDKIVGQKEFTMLDKRDVVTIPTASQIVINGTWQEGYQMTVVGRKMIEVSIVGNFITSVETRPLPDDISYWNFTDNQKRMIAIALDHPELNKMLEGTSDGTDYYVSSIRDHGMGDRGYVVIASSNTREGIYIVTLNQVTGDIIKENTGRVNNTMWE